MSNVLPIEGSGSREIIHFFRDVTDRRRVEHASAPETAPQQTSSKSGIATHAPSGFRFPALTTHEDQVLKLLAALQTK